MRILIGIEGFSHEPWSIPGVFYPESCDTPLKQLEYYSLRYDTVTITKSYNNIPLPSIYNEWAKGVEANPSFLFHIVVPKKVRNKFWWNIFWLGRDNKGGCKILYDKGILGCLILRFDAIFVCNSRNISQLQKMIKRIPLDIKISVDFLHRSWLENEEVLEEILEPNCCLTTMYVENGLAHYGWAGNLPSTRTKTAFSVKKQMFPIIVTSNFIKIDFYGTYGPGCGSYDKDNFLERFAKELRKLEDKVDTVFCSFHNIDSTICFPYPPKFISGFFLFPILEKLPEGVLRDLPCCLHDSQKLKKLLTVDKYRKDTEGFVDLEFVIEYS